MASKTLANDIQAFVSDHLLGGMDIAIDQELLLSDLLDSLGVINLVAQLESRFAIKVAAADVTLDNMRSVAAVVRYLHDTHGISDDTQS